MSYSPDYEEELRKLLKGIDSNAALETKTGQPASPTVDQESVLLEPPDAPNFVQQEDERTAEPGVSGDEPDDEEKPKPAPTQPATPVTIKNLFTHHDANALLLDMVLLDKYGPKWLTWEPETVWDEIADDYKQTVSTHNASKIQAMKTLHVVEAPWKAWEVFTPVCQAVNNNIPDFKTLCRPSVPQIIYAVTLMNLVNSEEQFSEEVSKFIAACFLDDDVLYLPPPVDFAQDEAMMLRYRCTKCGRIDVDEDNMMCDSCGAPQSALIKEPTWDPAPVKKRYDQIVSQGEDHDVLQESAVDIQVAKLLVAKLYTEFRMSQFKEQAGVVVDGQRKV